MNVHHHLPDLHKLRLSDSVNGNAKSHNFRSRGGGMGVGSDIKLSPIMDRDRASPSNVQIPEDIENADTSDPAMNRLRTYVKSLPYPVESNEEMQERLDLILTRLAQAVRCRDFEPGFLQYDSMLTYWTMLKYPIPKPKRIALVKLYYEVATTPGMPANVIAVAADALNFLTRSKDKLKLEDLRLPWKPIYKLLSKELFLSRRKFEINQLPSFMGIIVESTRRFFHPAAIDEMLETMLPHFNGTVLNSILSTEYYLLSFLPLSHPQSYLPALFRMWEAVNSYNFDERMLSFLASLAEMHVDPTVSDPARIESIPDDERSEDEGRPDWSKDDMHSNGPWHGIHKDVGIFTDEEWNLIMVKCLASMEIPLADTGSLTTGPSVDKQSTFEIGRLRKPTWRIYSLARIIVYSMEPDGIPVPPSGISTPFSPGMMTPGMTTPDPSDHLGDYLSSPLLKKMHRVKLKTYLAGSKALDSLARMIMSTENFFHPNNSGAWTADLSAFIKCIVYEFNKRWYEEQQPDCKTPLHRRLTKDMKRELVKSLRTVALLAMFSRDNTTVSNIQSCLKSMTVMEPDLILHPILERAIPALEALVETQRTTAMIKALGAVAPALVSRSVYYPGAKHLLQILESLIPGIDLNDPMKTLCTTAFLEEVSQHIQFGDLTSVGVEPQSATDTQSPEETRRPTNFDTPSEQKPAIVFMDMSDGARDDSPDHGHFLTNKEEDALLRETTAGFADWISAFIGRVILLLDNLPEEGTDGSLRGGESEVQVIDAVAGACSQICVHLSEPLFDHVLHLVFEYASTNVRSNAVRAVHQLVECMANADPRKTLAKFVPFCTRNIHVEIEHGASSLRTTSTSSPIPSDATLHWNLAILRGSMHNDGKAILKYKDVLLGTLKLLRDKALSKRGFSWSGKLLSSILLTLTHTYPLENKFVNPDEWNSEHFKRNHHRYWGKLYLPEDIKVSWHVPNDEEVDFALAIFRELIEPTLIMLENLLRTKPEARDSVWRNDFCRYLTIVRNGFSGTPTLLRENTSIEQLNASCDTSDIFNEIPEMIGRSLPIASCFVLTDKTDPRYQYLSGLRQRFGLFLKAASSSLRQQGEENTVDAVHLLIRAIRTYALDYGDSRDSYYSQSDQYSSEIGLTRLYAKQKVWPRAVLVRRIRRHHAARLRWNSIERLRGDLENSLIDEIVEWSMWHYSLGKAAQSLLTSLASTFDGVRRRCLPSFLKNIAPGGNDDRMKGALYALNMSFLTKYGLAEPAFRTPMLKAIFACQAYTDPSLQDCAANLADSCLGCIYEPMTIVFSVPDMRLNKAAAALEVLLNPNFRDENLIQQCLQKRVLRTNAFNEALQETVTTLINLAEDSNTHWRYSIIALRILRTLIKKEEPLTKKHMEYFLRMTHDSHPSLRYYGQRAVMKSLRYVKLRTFMTSPVDIAMEQNHNPLRKEIKLQNVDQEFSVRFLAEFKQKLNLREAASKPILQDKLPVGWLAWPKAIERSSASPPGETTLKRWEKPSEDMITAVREVALSKDFWAGLSKHFAEENHANVATQDNISCVKSLFQILEEEPLELVKPIIADLMNDVDQNKQRAASELTAGLIGGSKHWPVDAQERLWAWLTPKLTKVLTSSVKTDTMLIWTSFLEYLFFSRDPRRIQPLVDYLMETFEKCNFNSELSFNATKVASFTRALYEELGWRSSAWMDEILDRYWLELNNEHEEIRAYISDALEYSGKAKWRPKVSIPTPEVFVRECREKPHDFDIMGIRGTYHARRVSELVSNFKIWREERVPGARAFQSKYDRVGVMVCKWLFQALHDVQASSVFDYILPLMSELFRFSEVNDNDDLSRRANNLLVRMCGVIPPIALVDPLIDSIFDAIKTSPSWRVRLKALPLLQIFYFRQSVLISESKVLEMLEVICRCLDDENIEVREMAATTLSAMIRVSPRHGIITLKDRFVRLLAFNTLPARNSPVYAQALRKRHAAILGICALVDAFPYTVERWMPALLTDVLAEHTYEPPPVSTAVRKCASNFKKTHQDTWHEDSTRFTEDQLSALSTLLTGSSYYA